MRICKSRTTNLSWTFLAIQPVLGQQITQNLCPKNNMIPHWYNMHYPLLHRHALNLVSEWDWLKNSASEILSPFFSLMSMRRNMSKKGVGSKCAFCLHRVLLCYPIAKKYTTTTATTTTKTNFVLFLSSSLSLSLSLSLALSRSRSLTLSLSNALSL